MADITLVRETFYKEVFEPYNRAVKNGKYNKISYNLWRTIRDWCCDHQWTGYDIGITAVSCGYHIMLEHNDRVCPEVITVAFKRDFDSPAFAEYLHDHMKEISSKNIKIFYEALKQTAKAASDATAAYDSGVQSVKEAFYAYDTKINEINANDRYFAIGHDCEPNAIHLKADSIYIDEKSIPQYLEEMGIVIKEKENNNMKFNFDFGPVDSSVRMSLYGMAIKNASGTYVAYDAKSKQVMDVDIFNFEGANKFVYKMPAAFKDVAVGDVVIHARKPMFVMEKRDENRLNVLDIYDGEEKTIVLTKSPFNFDFITKVVSLFDFSGAASAANPFGNMLPFLMLSGENKDMNVNDILPFLVMNNATPGIDNNVLMFMALSNSKDMLPWLLMCGSQVLPTGCNCGCADCKSGANANEK